MRSRCGVVLASQLRQLPSSRRAMPPPRSRARVQYFVPAARATRRRRHREKQSTHRAPREFRDCAPRLDRGREGSDLVFCKGVLFSRQTRSKPVRPSFQERSRERHLFARSPGPLPESCSDARRQAVPQLPRQHDQLPTMVSLVRHEVAEKMGEIGRKVLPRRPGNRTATSNTEPDQPRDAFAAPRQRAEELGRTDRAGINGARDRNAMARTQHLDPHASRIVDVRRDHPDCPVGAARNTLRPQLGGEVLQEIYRDAVVGVPRGDQPLAVLGISRHSLDSRSTLRWEGVRSCFLHAC